MKQHQSGSVLAISLVLLTAITITALMGLQRSGLQSKIVANIQHKELAFRKSSFTAEDEIVAIDARPYQDKRELLLSAQRAYYANKKDNSVPNASVYSRQDSLSNYKNKVMESSITLLYKEPTIGGDEGKITAALKGQFSRGQNIVDIPRFELIASVQIPNGMQSAHAIGFKATPTGKQEGEE